MLQTVIRGPRDVALVEIGMPARSKGEVLVSVGAVGLCTLEQRVYRGALQRYPFLGGHEIGGVIAESDNPLLPVSTVVAVAAFPRCGECSLCSSGKDNLCGYRASGKHRGGRERGPGGLTEYICIREDRVFPVRGGVVVAALVEPLACVLHSLRTSGCEHGSTIAIIGMGVMGALHVIAARHLGMRVVWVELEGSSEPTRRLTSNPVSFSGISSDLLVEELARLSIAPQAAVCIRGGVAAVHAALDIVQPAGRVVTFASPVSANKYTIDLRRLRRSEVTISASVNHTLRDFAEAAEFAASLQGQLVGLIDRSFTLKEIHQGMEQAVTSDGGRIMICPAGY